MTAAKDPKEKKERPDEDLSEEDVALKEKLELLVTRAMDKESAIQKAALETIRTEIRSATSSMTSVPKPLKFLRPHFAPLKSYYASTMPDGENKVFLADVLSVLAMTMGDASRCESLRFKLRGSEEPPHLWGHEYVRHLSGEISTEFHSLSDPDVKMTDTNQKPSDKEAKDEEEKVFNMQPATAKQIHKLVDEIVPFLMSSNAEPEAVDLLIEVETLHKLVDHTDAHNYARVCLYLKACAEYVSEKEDVDLLLKIAADIYKKADKLPQAMQVAIRRDDYAMIKSIYLSSPKPSAVRLQLALDLGRANILLDEETEDDEDLRNAMMNRKLSDQFHSLAKDLDVLEPKVPEDIYKTHLLDSRAPTTIGGHDSARTNLAKTFVNAFVNMGFKTDKLMSDADTKWIYHNKDHGMMSAAASLGLIYLWEVDVAMDELDKYGYAQQEYVRAGALLATGLVSANVRHDVEPCFALLSEHVKDETASIRHGAIAGMGIAYANSRNQAVKDCLLPILEDSTKPADTISITALALGLTFIGSADEDIYSPLFQVLSDRKDSDEVTREPLLQIYLPLALGLLYLGRQEATEPVLETIEALVGTDSLLGRIASITLQACAYCGSGNVLKIQKFLSICGEHPSTEDNEDSAANGSSNAVPGQGSRTQGLGAESSGPKAGQSGEGAPDTTAASNATAAAAASNESDERPISDADKAQIQTAEQSVAVLGLAMVAMGEELGAEMSIRTFGHLMQYCDPVVRRVVPLAIGLISVSNPRLQLMDLLSKYTHDSDLEVAQSAIMALGFIGAGTNNSRIAGILRQLSVYYSKEAAPLFLVRIAQGLLHSGKGLVTMSPYYGDNKFLEHKSAIGGILTVLFACLDMKGTILGRSHYLLYFLSLAARPRMVFTVDEKMEFKGTTVRVGQAVDTVGQAGRPKSITGFQTHTTPVLLAAGERSEMATEEFLPVSASMEGIVVLEKNPDWVDESGLEEAAAAMDKMQTDAGSASGNVDGKKASSSEAAPSS